MKLSKNSVANSKFKINYLYLQFYLSLLPLKDDEKLRYSLCKLNQMGFFFKFNGKGGKTQELCWFENTLDINDRSNQYRLICFIESKLYELIYW